MGLIEKTALETGIEFVRDVPSPRNRRTRDWSKVIGTIRKLESQEAEMVKSLADDKASLAAKNAGLVEELAEAKQLVAAYRLKERMSEAHVSERDQKFLLTGNGEQDAE